MGEEVKYQLRLSLSDPFAQVARNFPDDPSIAPLTQLPAKFHSKPELPRLLGPAIFQPN
jgi:hypothetical protein